MFQCTPPIYIYILSTLFIRYMSYVIVKGDRGMEKRGRERGGGRGSGRERERERERERGGQRDRLSLEETRIFFHLHRHRAFLYSGPCKLLGMFPHTDTSVATAAFRTLLLESGKRTPMAPRTGEHNVSRCWNLWAWVMAPPSPNRERLTSLKKASVHVQGFTTVLGF